MICLKYDKPIKRSYQNLVLLNAGSTNTVSMKNFAKSYRYLGGRKIPDEIVNMIIRNTQMKMRSQNEYKTHKKTSMQTSQVIHSITGIRGKELWRLSHTFCEHQFGFKTSYLKWSLYRIVNSVI